MRLLAVSLALVALFIFAATSGGLWHHHSESSSGNCSICHLNHESLEHFPHGQCAPVLIALAAGIEPRAPRFTRNNDLPPLPARAPPSA